MNEIILHANGLKAFFDDAHEAAKRIDGGDYTPQPARFGFASAADMYETMTPARWYLLDALRQMGPMRRDQLAAALDREPDALENDLSALKPIELVEEDEAGLLSVPWAKITTEVVFDRDAA